MRIQIYRCGVCVCVFMYVHVVVACNPSHGSHHAAGPAVFEAILLRACQHTQEVVLDREPCLVQISGSPQALAKTQDCDMAWGMIRRASKGYPLDHQGTLVII